ncbi:hypothetical protein EDD16DRAFT_1706848 [Pisolithus croceorrhizus]|nr:hypothetical protein EDD16DRAFT_1706848 [Pisolithus croceorrhizus]KAI6160574.1 hypothetical protein EDD17DRAFT_1760719 [Pisolithus thermaeus]
MPPLPNDATLLGKLTTIHSIAEHAIGCLLTAEYSYFLMQQGHHVWKEVLPLAVEEYKISKIQTVISEDVRAILHDLDGDMNGICEAIIRIIIKNHMSDKLLREKEADKV